MSASNAALPAMLSSISSGPDGSPQLGSSSLRPPPALGGAGLAPGNVVPGPSMKSEASSGYSSMTSSPAAFGAATAQRSRSRSPSGLRDGRVGGGEWLTGASLCGCGWVPSDGRRGVGRRSLGGTVPAPSSAPFLLHPFAVSKTMPVPANRRSSPRRDAYGRCVEVHAPSVKG